MNKPRLKNGQFISTDCPRCGCGELELDIELGIEFWRCNGLIDPDHPDKPLEVCPVVLMDGELLNCEDRTV